MAAEAQRDIEYRVCREDLCVPACGYDGQNSISWTAIYDGQHDPALSNALSSRFEESLVYSILGGDVSKLQAFAPPGLDAIIKMRLAKPDGSPNITLKAVSFRVTYLRTLARGLGDRNEP